MALAFNHPCKTPKGPATFIATVDDGSHVQVSRHARFDELTRDQIERAKPIITEWSEQEIREWLKRATYCKNEIYKHDEVTAC